MSNIFSRLYHAVVYAVFTMFLVLLVLFSFEFFERKIHIDELTSRSLAPKVVVIFGHGTGIVVGSRTVLTAAHVVQEIKTDNSESGTTNDLKTPVVIKTFDDKEYLGSVLNLDASQDLAVVETAPVFGVTAAIQCVDAKPGQKIWSIGHPLILRDIYTFGYVSSYSSGKWYWSSVQVVDLTVGLGMSGGPVFNHQGELVGIIVGTLAGGFSPVGSMTLMVPGSTICKYLKSTNSNDNLKLLNST